MKKSWRLLLLAPLLALQLPAWALAQISLDVSVDVPPPELPVYDQPPIPADGYLWTPGYWAWDDDAQDYYWVPGTWVPAPQPDYLWTPGYWAADGAVFLWHGGYWGPQVGFYGGVNYGYGYGGNGYQGGYWRDGHLNYNSSVNNINKVQITNVYNKTVINNVTVNRISYNGGNGIRAQPSPAELAAARAPHLGVTSGQREQVDAARRNPALHMSQIQGHPPIAATARPGDFSGPGVVRARNAAAPGAVRSDNAPALTNPGQREEPVAPQRQQEQEQQPRDRPVQQPRPEVQEPRPAAPARPAEHAPEHTSRPVRPE